MLICNSLILKQSAKLRFVKSESHSRFFIAFNTSLVLFQILQPQSNMSTERDVGAKLRRQKSELQFKLRVALSTSANSLAMVRVPIYSLDGRPLVGFSVLAEKL